MIGLTTLRSQFRCHKKQVLVHGCILGSFLLYCLFLAAPLFDRFEAIPGEAKPVSVQLPEETDNLHYNVDRLVVSKSALEIHGWAFIDGFGAENNETFVVLKSDRGTYIFETSAVFDATVTAEYGGPGLNLDWSGFITTVPTRKIERGDYIIGVYITRGDISALRYSDKVIIKSRDDVKQTESTLP